MYYISNLLHFYSSPGWFQSQLRVLKSINNNENNNNNNKVDFVIDVKSFIDLINFECCCWNRTLTENPTCWFTRDARSCRIIIFNLKSFSLLWMVFEPITCFNLVFCLNAIVKSVQKVFLQLCFFCNMSQCFVRISFRFIYLFS